MPIHTSMYLFSSIRMYLFSCFRIFSSKLSALNHISIAILTLVLLLFSLPGRSSAQQTPQLLGWRIIAGGGSYTDTGGNRWNADQPYSPGSWGYVGGKTYRTSKSIANTKANTNNEPLYQSERYGDFSYKFDVPNGLYNVALHFAEIYWETPGERIFDVFIEGSRVLDRYDICAAVGRNTALALTFPGVQVQDGQLNIDFVTVKDNAKVSAISITSSVSYPPGVSLTSPTAGTTFSPGQAVTATGSGQNLRWDIDRINDGLPSFATGQGNSITFTIPANSNASQFIRITLMGDSGTATRDYSIFVPPPPPPSPPPFSRGPLKVHQSNPRYFTDGTGKAVYLTGSHNWLNLSDWGVTSPPPSFDFTAYLDFLQARNHNFIRLWRWELSKFDYGSIYEGILGNPLYSEPHPWARSGPGTALDGGPKFNLNQFNQAYFDRLRERVSAARDRGIYVSIMFFEGHGLYRSLPPWRWAGHPMNASNNINGINGDPDGDGYGTETQTLQIPAVTAIQQAYLRKVIDAVNDLDNVLYEICNEPGDYSVQWQYQMVNFIKSYEATKPKQHPVGMTALWGNPPELSESPADWISPGESGDDPVYSPDPPANNGTKVILLDTDHMANNYGGVEPATRVWVWKSFTRGYNLLYMDPIPSVTGDDLNQRNWTDARGEDVRWAMGHTRSYASKMNLAAMRPRGDLTPTGYALANPGQEYLVYAPSGGNFIVNLSGSSQNFTVEWFNPATGTRSDGGNVAGGANRSFSPPFSGDAVLYLKASGI